MEEFLSILENASPIEKADLLPLALEYDSSGINFLIEHLNDSQLIVRATAYELLKNIELQQAQQAVAEGLLFNPGDTIYQVYQSAIYFNDSNYRLFQDKNKAQSPVIYKKQLNIYEDYYNQGYKIVSFDESAYVMSKVPYYINYDEAQTAAEYRHREILSQFSIEEFAEYNANSKEEIKQWCFKYKLDERDITNTKLEKDRQSGIVEWYQKNNLDYKPKKFKYLYWYPVADYLNSIQNFNLLSKLWKDVVGSFTYISEITFAKKTYLTIDKYFAKINSNTKKIFPLDYDPREINDTLLPEEAETDYLIEALNHPELEIRNIAYQLLKGIDLDKARQAIHLGVKLNPGDRIYSVYRAGMWFTDDSYFLETWGIDYLSELWEQVYENYDVHEEEEGQGFGTRREFCFVEKEQAEQKAEFLHRERIKQGGIGVGGFEWEKENPNFNIKQWFIDNNIPHKCRYDWQTKIFSLKFENYTLFSKFMRDKYLYHPDHIDTWCKDNNLYFDSSLKSDSLEYWDNYKKILDHLYLPENIELLSKFWKDGVGQHGGWICSLAKSIPRRHFAFVKEEFVQETTYVRIGDNLIDPVSRKSTTAIIVRPGNYYELATDFLINVLNKTNIRAKFRAYELLQYIKTEKAQAALAKGIPINLGDQIYPKQEPENPLKDDFNISAETSEAEFEQYYRDMNEEDILF